MNTVYRKTLAIIWTILTVLASTLPPSTTRSISIINIPGLDKIGHAVMYCIFFILWAVALKNKKNNLFKVFSTTIAFGILMEYVQFQFFEGRHFELLDIIANIIGSLIGVVLFKTFFK